MAEEQLSQSNKILTFVSGKHGLGLRWIGLLIFIPAATILFGKRAVTFESLVDSIGPVAVPIFLMCTAALTVTRQWTAEVDPQARILTILRIHKLRWTRIVLRATVIERCSFDECSMLGTTVYETGDLTSYGVYLDFKRGGRHAIPVQNGTLNEAERAASELTAATGIPRQDEVR